MGTLLHGWVQGKLAQPLGAGGGQDLALLQQPLEHAHPVKTLLFGIDSNETVTNGGEISDNAVRKHITALSIIYKNWEK